MGQKVHPYGFRLGYTKPWKSRWFVERDYDKLLLEDVKLKNELKDKLKAAGQQCVYTTGWPSWTTPGPPATPSWPPRPSGSR